MQNKDIDLIEILETLLTSQAEIAPRPREEIWASDLGKSYVERYLQMTGVPYTNPIPALALRNFLIGNKIEEGFKDLLTQCRIPQEELPRLEYKLPNCLTVVGRPDLILEVSSWDKVKKEIKKEIKTFKKDEIRLIDKKNRLLEGIGALESIYPKGFERTLFEIKTVAAYAAGFAKKIGWEKSYPHYVLQLYLYMKALKMKEGRLLFLIKGTNKTISWIEQIKIQESKELDEKLHEDIETMTKYYKDKVQPPLEPLFVAGRKNWKTGYSRYYDLLYKKAYEEYYAQEGGEMK